MSEAVQLKLLQLVGFIAVGFMVWVATELAPTQPLIGTSLASFISWFIGKLMAQPMPMVTLNAVEGMRPEAADQLAARLSHRPSPPPTPPMPPITFINKDK
jgi:hypothetical protein